MGEATAAGAWASGSVELASCVCEVPRRRLLDRVRDALRLRHYSRRTERAYVAWIRRYVLFHGKRHPAEKFSYGPPSWVTREIIDNPDKPLTMQVKSVLVYNLRTGFWFIVVGTGLQVVVVWL